MTERVPAVRPRTATLPTRDTRRPLDSSGRHAESSSPHKSRSSKRRNCLRPSTPFYLRPASERGAWPTRRRVSGWSPVHLAVLWRSHRLGCGGAATYAHPQSGLVVKLHLVAGDWRPSLVTAVELQAWPVAAACCLSDPSATVGRAKDAGSRRRFLSYFGRSCEAGFCEASVCGWQDPATCVPLLDPVLRNDS